VTKRNDPRLNNHQIIQLQGWRGNCDIQVIIDYHACIEYLCKYAAKGEPRSPMLIDTFNAILKNVKPDSDPQKAMKKVLIRTFGDRDFSAQETMHLLLSLKLHSTSFQVLPVNLNGSRRVEVNVVDTELCTKNSLLDVYANRIKFKNVFPDIMSVNLVDFATNFTVKKNSLGKQTCNVVPRIFPNYSSNPKGDNYALFCKYQLLKYKP
jgi:hypothetical protein